MQATTSPRSPGRVAECSDTPPVRFGSQHKKAATDSEAIKGPGKWSKTSLSQGAKGDDSQGSVGDALESAGDADNRVGYWAGELRQLLWLALPVMAQVASQPAMIITDQLMLGHFLGAEKLAAAALGHSWFNLWFYFLMGVLTAQDTLGSQSHGSRDEVAFWHTTGASFTVTTVLVGVMMVGMWFAEDVVQHLFLLQSSPTDVSEAAGLFCKWLIPGLWPVMWSMVGTKALQTRGIVMPSVVIGAAVFVANIFFNLLFVPLLGFIGSPIATSSSRVVEMLMTLGYVMRDMRPNKAEDTSGETTIKPWSLFVEGALAWKPMASFLMLGIPGGIMLFAEAFAYDFDTALASRISTAAVDAHTILYSVASFMVMSLPFGMGVAGTIRVGNLLGAGCPRNARTTGNIILLTCTFIMLLTGLLMLALRQHIGALFVDDSSVIALTAAVTPVMAGVMLWAGLNSAAAGVLRGMGQQALVLLINITSYWTLGLILGYIMAFTLGMGLRGLWYGLLLACLSSASIEMAYFLFTDMEHHMKLAQQRVQSFRCSDGEVPKCKTDTKNGKNEV